MYEIKEGQVWEAHDKKKNRRQVRIDVADLKDQTAVVKNTETGRSTLVSFKTLHEHWVLVQDVPVKLAEKAQPVASANAAPSPAPAQANTTTTASAAGTVPADVGTKPPATNA